MTIGIGHNLDAAGLCSAAIQAQLACDIAAAKAEMDQHLPWWNDQPPLVHRVLLNLMFNLGPSKLLTFTTFLGLVRAGQYMAAADDLLGTLYAKEVGARANRLADLLRSVL